MYDLSQTTFAKKGRWGGRVSGFVRLRERDRDGVGRCRHLMMAKYGVPWYNPAGTSNNGSWRVGAWAMGERNWARRGSLGQKDKQKMQTHPCHGPHCPSLQLPIKVSVQIQEGPARRLQKVIPASSCTRFHCRTAQQHNHTIGPLLRTYHLEYHTTTHPCVLCTTRGYDHSHFSVLLNKAQQRPL